MLLDREVRSRDGTWTEGGDRILVRLPPDLRLLLSLDNPERMIGEASTDEGVRAWLAAAFAVDERESRDWVDIEPPLRWSIEPISMELPGMAGSRLSEQ